MQLLEQSAASLTLGAGTDRPLSGALAYEFDSRARCSTVSREIPSLRILAMSVVLFSPSLEAAPLFPPTTQFVSWRVAMMCARSASASVRKTQFGTFWLVSSAIGARNSAPLVRITDRSIKFCSSRILPGHSYLTRAVITSSGMCSIGFRMRAAGTVPFFRLRGPTDRRNPKTGIEGSLVRVNRVR